MKKVIGTIGLAAALAVAGAVAQPNVAHADDPEVITISGAGPQGRWFKLASLYAKILDREIEDKSFNGVTGKGISIGNLKRVNANNVQAGFSHFYHLSQALDHTGVFKDDETDYSNAVAWFNQDENFIRVIADIEYKTIADLKGKTVSIGVRGSGDDEQCKAVLGVHGVTEENTEFQYTSRNDATNALSNKQIDGLCNSFTRNNRGHLQPLFSAREVGKEVDFVEHDMAALEKLVKERPEFFIDEKGESVFGRPNLVGVGYRQGAVVYKGLSEDLVYRMTKALFENWDEVKESAPWMEKHGGPEEAANQTFVPYHPGAIKYYKEVGAWKG